MIAATNPARFTRFAVQRCIRILFSDDEQGVMPIHALQDESILEPIMFDVGFGPGLQLYLLQVDGDDGDVYSIVETSDGPFYARATEGEGDPTCRLSHGDFGGVRWRVVAYQEGFPNDPFHLGTHEDEHSAEAVCKGLSALLEPVRVIVGMC